MSLVSRSARYTADRCTVVRETPGDSYEGLHETPWTWQHYGIEGCEGAFNWATIMPRDGSLSDSEINCSSLILNYCSSVWLYTKVSTQSNGTQFVYQCVRKLYSLYTYIFNDTHTIDTSWIPLISEAAWFCKFFKKYFFMHCTDEDKKFETIVFSWKLWKLQ